MPVTQSWHLYTISSICSVGDKVSVRYVTKFYCFLYTCIYCRVSASVLPFRCFWFKYDLGQMHYAPQVWPDRDSNSSRPDHDSTCYATEMPALTTWPSVTLYKPLKRIEVAIFNHQADCPFNLDIWFCDLQTSKRAWSCDTKCSYGDQVSLNRIKFSLLSFISEMLCYAYECVWHITSEPATPSVKHITAYLLSHTICSTVGDSISLTDLAPSLRSHGYFQSSSCF